ncbi:helix-turn-helix domain-containing protein [Flavimarina sp. Hel_I_48]|uniref:helix-turn-helix domain-containing protein n=1 Tax=Flavimarina sp. Hel_I_48 TaxID=1392488 RepID=UPI0004DF68B6|nr:AraC family transcriptional regulator [Flavimarina sp. Hel_I_48]
MEKTIYVKNMVCDRCIKVLRDELQKISVEVIQIKLGEIQVNLKKGQQDQLVKVVEDNGFSIIDSEPLRIVEQVKITLVKLLDELPLILHENLSVYLSKKLNQDYAKVSKVFSVTEKITIEKYFIKLKIEKVKELIQANTQNFSEISQLLDYSNANHLSRQFKKETGMSLSMYKSQQENFRNSLDQIV